MTLQVIYRVIFGNRPRAGSSREGLFSKNFVCRGAANGGQQQWQCYDNLKIKTAQFEYNETGRVNQTVEINTVYVGRNYKTHMQMCVFVYKLA